MCVSRLALHVCSDVLESRLALHVLSCCVYVAPRLTCCSLVCKLPCASCVVALCKSPSASGGVVCKSPCVSPCVPSVLFTLWYTCIFRVGFTLFACFWLGCLSRGVAHPSLHFFKLFTGKDGDIACFWFILACQYFSFLLVTKCSYSWEVAFSFASLSLNLFSVCIFSCIVHSYSLVFPYFHFSFKTEGIMLYPHIVYVCYPA